jgi:type IV secretory pathway protease TraF
MELIVDKIVIAQQSLQAFINTLSPGAYASITKVNFKKLDKCSLKPLGVYGSKEEIVKFLREIHAVDDKTAGILLKPQNAFNATGAEPILRSGLYVVRSFVSPAEEQAYVLYWPEDTTWDDQAISTVQRNRVTFMRYLTKLCDQIVCLLSSEHSQAIVWGDEDGDDASTDSDNDDSGRLYDFVVAKTNDEEENVVAKPGFKVHFSYCLPPY